TLAACWASAANGATTMPPVSIAMKVRRCITGSSRRQSASQERGDAGRGETGPGPCRSPPYRLGGSLAEPEPLRLSAKTCPKNAQDEPEGAARVRVFANLLGGVGCPSVTNSPHSPKAGLFPL